MFASDKINKVIEEYYKLTDYKNPYNNLTKSNERQNKVCQLLENLLFEKDLPDEIVMWAYWNISDNYATQRKADELYNNHTKFEKFLLNQDLKYKLLLLVDSTQRLTLISGGYSDYWDTLYFEIINKIDIDETNYKVVFNVLRTATYNHDINTNDKVIEHALKQMECIISKYDYSNMINWFKLCYYNSLLAYNYKKHKEDEELLNNCYELFCKMSVYLKVDNKEELLKKAHVNDVLMGSYDYWNKEIDSYRQARFLQNIIITLINTKHYEFAKKCYEQVEEDEFTSSYFKSKINLIK